MLNIQQGSTTSDQKNIKGRWQHFFEKSMQNEQQQQQQNDRYF